MSKSIMSNKKTGQVFPKKSQKKRKDKKHFGFRYGDGSNPNSKKGVDFINDGYPLELRHKSTIKQKIMDDLTNEELRDIIR
jgi:hypothetical protein